MQYTRILAICVTAISLAIMPTSFSSPTMPFYQQEAYATHPCPPGFTPVHDDGIPLCLPPDPCEIDPTLPGCQPPEEPPLTELYKNQGQCIKAGVDKDLCKAAFKADNLNA